MWRDADFLLVLTVDGVEGQKIRRFPIRSASHGRIDLGVVRASMAEAAADTTLTEAQRAQVERKGREVLRTAIAPKASPLSGMPLREAQARFTERVASLNERIEAVEQAVRARYRRETPLAGEYETYGYACAVYEDSVVVRERSEGGVRYWSLPYTVDASGKVTLGEEPVEFEQIYAPKEAVDSAIAAGHVTWAGHLLSARESAGQAGGLWDILIIQEGLSKNRNRYRREVLAKAAPQYEGRPIFVNHAESERRFGRGIEELAGFVRDVRPMFLTESEQAPRFALAATAGLTLPWLREAFANAAALGNPGLYGFSHDVAATFTVVHESDGPVQDVTEITAVASVDAVSNPAAGGRATRLVASVIDEPHDREDRSMDKAHMIEALRRLRPDLLEKLGANPDEATDAQVRAVFAEAMATKPSAATTTPAPVAAAAPVATAATASAARATEAAPNSDRLAAEYFKLRRTNAGLEVSNALAGCALPDVLKQRIKSKFATRLSEATSEAQLPTEAEIVAAIKESVDDYAQLVESKVVLPSPGAVSFQETKTRIDNVKQRLGDFFDQKKEATSFRELYIEITGDKRITGQIGEATLLREALSTSSWAEVLGDSIRRAAVAEYRGSELTAVWRNTIASVVPASDFRVQRRVRFGGYPNLSVVAENGGYPALTSPGDEEATYSVAKRGGTESVSLEMIRNDDVGAIRRIPSRMGRAAAQTLYEFIFDFFATNPTIYDGAALATVGKGNLLTTALAASVLVTARTSMKKQADMASGKRLGLSPKYLYHPLELQELAWQLTTTDRAMPDSSVTSTAAAAAPSFTKYLSITPVLVDYWTDTNNFAVTADVGQVPILEVAFLDGQEDPELQVQDQPNVGSMFSNDRLTWKIKHTYGAGIIDYRGVVLGVVA